MARIDAIVLGAGIVGTSIGLHLAKRGPEIFVPDVPGSIVPIPRRRL
jgi:glycine/D-amino acid oxidase-like deaminating enzyme